VKNVFGAPAANRLRSCRTPVAAAQQPALQIAKNVHPLLKYIYFAKEAVIAAAQR